MKRRKWLELKLKLSAHFHTRSKFGMRRVLGGKQKSESRLIWLLLSLAIGKKNTFTRTPRKR